MQNKTFLRLIWQCTKNYLFYKIRQFQVQFFSCLLLQFKNTFVHSNRHQPSNMAWQFWWYSIGLPGSRAIRRYRKFFISEKRKKIAIFFWKFCIIFFKNFIAFKGNFYSIGNPMVTRSSDTIVSELLWLICWLMPLFERNY